MPRPTLEKPNPKLVKIPGRRKWYIRWTENRRSKFASTGTESEVEAEQCLSAFIVSINALPDQPTISDLLDLRPKARGPYVANVKNLETFARPLKMYFGHYQPHQITAAVQAGYIDFRGGKIPTVKRELEELRAALAVVDDPPKILIPKAAPPRERFMTQDEASALPTPPPTSSCSS